MPKRVILPRIAPLIRVVATEITDPAERAALDEAHRRARRKRSGGKAKTSGNGKKSGSSAAARKQR
jgi:hypothetical protein